MAPKKKPRSHAAAPSHRDRFVVHRVQTGVRIEKRLLKVLKAFAEFRDLSLGDLLEGIVLHAFDNKAPFSSESLKRIAMLKEIYGLDLDSSSSHQLQERSAIARKRGA
jgi:predicted DNA-binding ribbon-helix-helix protein